MAMHRGHSGNRGGVLSETRCCRKDSQITGGSMSDLKVDVNAGNLGVGLIDHIKSLDDRIGVLEMKSGIKPEAQGSGYTHGWDKGFAQEGDPYGIHAEYLPQSANPDAAKPTVATLTSSTYAGAPTGTVI